MFPDDRSQDGAIFTEYRRQWVEMLLEDEARSTEIYELYIFNIEDNENPNDIFLLDDIVAQVAPEILEKANETFSRSVVSDVAEIIFKRKCLEQLERVPFIKAEDREDEVERLYSEFNAERIRLTGKKGANMLIEKDPSHFKKLQDLARQARGVNTYSNEFLIRYVELRKSVRYESGPHKGQPNMNEITEVLNNEFGTNATKKTNSRYHPNK